MAYPPATLLADLLNETDAETGVDDAAALEAEGGTPGEGEHAERHNLAAAAINDIVTELGANPSGVEATVQARLEALGLSLASKADATAVTEALAAKASKAELAAEESARISGLSGKASTAALSAEESARITADAAKASKTELGTEESARIAADATKAALVHEHTQYDPYDTLPYIIPMGWFPGTTIGPGPTKRAWLLRFTVAKKRTFKFIRFAQTAAGTGEDKIDVGIYEVEGEKLKRLASSGAVKTLTNESSVKAIEFTGSAVCSPGIVYFASMAWETVTGSPQVAALLNNSGLYSDIGGKTVLANRIQTFKAESFPLPSTIESILAASSSPVPWMVPSES